MHQRISYMCDALRVQRPSWRIVFDKKYVLFSLLYAIASIRIMYVYLCPATVLAFVLLNYVVFDCCLCLLLFVLLCPATILACLFG